MTQQQTTAPDSLEGKSPFELRIYKGPAASESVVKQSLDSGDVGFMHSFTTGSTVDGPGVRVVAWMAGCQWRCLYCHNPDTWNMLNGTPVTLARAVEELRKYKFGLKVMSGGFTISGGEALMQDRFCVRLFDAAKKMGIHTSLDTNGFLGARLSDEDLKTIDLVQLDIKTWDSQRHRHLTGKDNAPTLEFARTLAAKKRSVWLRFVLVPNLTDDPVDIGHIAKFAASLGNVERVDVLPFHQMGRYKWKELNIPYTLNDTLPAEGDGVKRAIAIFAAEGLTVY